MKYGRRMMSGVGATVVLAVCSLAFPGATGAQGVDEEAAERAAEEIQAARTRANLAAEEMLDAQIELEALEDRADALAAEAAALQTRVDGLRAEAADLAVRRFTASGTSDIPLLVGAETPNDRLQAGLLAEIVLEGTANTTDEYESTLRESEAAQRAVADNQAEVLEQREAFEDARRNAEAEVVRLQEVEEQRLRDEQVRIALERKQAEERRRREAAEAAARAAAERAAAERAAAERAAAEAAAEQRTLAAQRQAAAPPAAADSDLPAAPAPAVDGGDDDEGEEDEAPAPPPAAASGGGFVCPVRGSSAYADTWGAPRSGGRTHEGVDFIAAHGTPLVAVEAGSVQFKQTSLGGNSVWLNGASGTRYFYAHLASFEGSSRGVSRGEVIGYVGATGNANGTNPLHFEVHPGGGAAVNPTPFARNAGC